MTRTFSTPSSRSAAPAPVKTVRCAIYTRKSSEEGLKQDFNSLDAQRESAEAYIASQRAQGWVALPQHFDDGGYSGGNIDRPALDRLLAAIQGGEVDCVVVYKVDRLSRSLMDFARIMEIFDKHQVSFVSVTQHFNTTHSMGRLTLNILLSFAQFEREIIGERIRDKLSAQRKRGQWTGGIPVLGYDVDRSGQSPRLVVNAAEATQVREIFELYLQQASLLKVAQELDRRGWKNKPWKTRAGTLRGGHTLDIVRLHGLLTNPLYTGKVCYKKVPYPGQHEAIIRPEVFAQVQTLLQHNRTAGGNVNRNKYGALLRGLLYCKCCNAAMTASYRRKGDREYRYYTCLHAIKRGYAKCPSKSLPLREIERLVVEQVRGLAQDKTLLAEVLTQTHQARTQEQVELETQLQEVAQELTRHRAQLHKLESSGGTDPAATGQIVELHQRIVQGERAKTDLARQFEHHQQEPFDDRIVTEVFQNFDATWAHLSPSEQARLLSLLIARIEYDGNQGTVALQFRETGIQNLAQELVEVP
jgi:site-specific DNA recombinase